MNDNLEVQEFRTADQLTSTDAFGAWHRLVKSRPLRSPTWLLGWWKHFATETSELRVLLVHDRTLSDQKTLVGVAPLYANKIAGRTTLHLLGERGDVCTDHTTFFSADGREQDVGASVARYLAKETLWQRLHLETIDCHDFALQSTLECLRRRGGMIHRQPTVSCWSLSLPESWEDYLAMVSKSHRKRCRRLSRAWFETGRVVVHEATSEKFDDVWNTFLKLHAKRWGDARRPDGSFTNPRFRSFHIDVARTLFDSGQVRLCYLTCDERPIAAEYQLLDDDTLYAYQSGMEPDCGDVQPGNLSLIATIQFCIERGLSTMDLLRGDEPYKAHWRATPQPCEHVRVWPNGVAGHIERGYLGVKELAARIANRR